MLVMFLNFSRQAGDFGSNLVATSKISVVMAIQMVLTWRVVSSDRQLSWAIASYNRQKNNWGLIYFGFRIIRI